MSDDYTNGLLRAAEIALQRSMLAAPGKPTWAMENVYRGICLEAGVDPDKFEQMVRARLEQDLEVQHLYDTNPELRALLTEAANSETVISDRRRRAKED